MSVALRGGKKPFVPGDAIGAVARADRASGVGPHIGTALLLRHAHADQAAALFLERDIARIVFAREQPRHPVAGQPGVPAHRRDGSIGHGRRTQRPALDLRLHQVARGTGARALRAAAASGDQGLLW